MGIMNKVSDISRGMNEMSKTASETNNLKKKIAYEQERIQEVTLEIGNLYYESGEKELQKLKELCADIDDRKRRIQSMKNDFHQIKGQKYCASCGMKFDEKYQFEFCGKCGKKLKEA